MERLGATPEYLFGWNGSGNNITREMVIDRDQTGNILRNFISPPSKDTVAVPDAGYTLVRIQARNPGIWLLHCHMSWHNHIGMGVILNVGGKKDWPSMPKNFPKSETLYKYEISLTCSYVKNVVNPNCFKKTTPINNQSEKLSFHSHINLPPIHNKS